MTHTFSNNYSMPEFWKHIDKTQIHSVAEVGSLHALDALQLHQMTGKPVFAFEADPDSANICRKNVEDSKEEDVTVVESAVCTVDGTIDYWSVDKKKYANTGASSMYYHTFSTHSPDDPEYKHPCIQKKVTVPSVRLDTYFESKTIPNLLCMDVQGAELEVLKGAGERLREVKYIIAECSFNTGYKNGVNFPELHDYLQKHGFKFVYSTLHKDTFPRQTSPYRTEFDALYLKS